MLLMTQAEFFNNYLRDLTRPGQQDVQSQHTASSGSAGAVRMDERTNLSPTTHNNPAGWGQPPQMVFPRGQPFDLKAFCWISVKNFS